MQVQVHAWEHTLLSLAYEARASISKDTDWSAPTELLEQAYGYCESITGVHSRSFHLASGLLPLEKRRHARALYAFCRISDDIVDGQSANRSARLAHWRQRVLNRNPAEDDLIALAWTDTRLRCGIPVRYAEQLIDGVAQDLTLTRYESFDDLAAYAYGVASTVGLMSMHIVGFATHEAVRYAIKLGVALQLTNILRDVGEDWRNGRVYLPQDELHSFGLSESDLAEGVVSDRWRRFMKFQIERNRRLYEEAYPGIGFLDSSGRFSIGAAADLYRAILDDIEVNDYDVFSRRAYVGTWGKVRRLPGIWWRSRRI